ncbi:hypothetical protein JHL17_17870 [Azospirillum sp. YIM B02556]|uniref:Response regulatory domain-containing protein n=1 Tax=Azospirillum endophyticum TaxID=2800326 RepID=A0ABS1F788_9PROT|nr:hypothetical protein [Azospirillum endophyticum]MBK1839281.1 hypothetical protein [Azospirillum endophyticum]
MTNCGMGNATMSPACRPAICSPEGRVREERVHWALVADRNPLLREGLRLYLETLGWRVVAGGTVDEGLALLAGGHLVSPTSKDFGPGLPDLMVVGKTEPERRDPRGPWPSVSDQPAAMRGAVRPVLLSIAATNHDLMTWARDHGFEVIHIDIPPLNLEDLLLGCVRRIERG